MVAIRVMTRPSSRVGRAPAVVVLGVGDVLVDVVVRVVVLLELDVLDVPVELDEVVVVDVLLELDVSGDGALPGVPPPHAASASTTETHTDRPTHRDVLMTHLPPPPPSSGARPRRERRRSCAEG
ncbi:MAG: hypothetical protein ACTHLJ_07035 [Angustibacter sp.]